MITRADGVLLAVLAFIVVCSMLYARRVLRRDRQAMQKYKLYRVRDRFIHLVGTKAIREEDFLFQSLYRATNNLIRGVKRINLKTMIESLRRQREEGHDPAEREELEKIVAALKCQPPEVVEAVSEFYVTVTEILVENSFILRWGIRSHRVHRILRKILTWASKHLNSPEPATISYYRDYRRGGETARAVVHA